MRERSRLVWYIVLVLGWLLDLLFWKQAPGVNFAIYAALCLAGGLLVMRLDGARLARRSAWLLLPIAAFAVTSFVRAEPLTMSLSVVLTLFLMAVLAITYVGGRWLEYSLLDYGLGLLRLGWAVITEPLTFLTKTGSAQQPEGKPGVSAWSVLRGLLLALPILLMFAVLLGSADLVFRHQLDELMKLLSLERLPEYMFRLIYILVAACALLGVFIHAAAHSKDERLLGEARPLSARLLGFVESSIVLGSVVILFSAFVLVQFRYFFGGGENIGLQGYTFSEYARRGYGELMAVAFLSLLLLLGLGALTRRDTLRRQRIFSALGVLVVLLVGVMLVSAYMRLSLYEMAYGFTRLRTYVHVSLIWLGLLLAAVVVLEILRRERLFAAAALIASLGFGLSLSVLNVDAFIVRQNVGRALSGRSLDVPHLASLSTDAVPALVELYRSVSTLPVTKDAVGAALACKWNGSRSRLPSDWRSFTVSRWLALRALDTVAAELDRYQLGDSDWPRSVISPQGVSYDCIPYRD